jgi:hypothetical protein
MATPPLFSKADVTFLEARIKEEIRFIHIPIWDEPPGGHEGRLIWAWNVEAQGPKAQYRMVLAERGLRRDIQRHIATYVEIFEECTTEIDRRRRLALLDLLFDLGEKRFRKQRRALNRIFHADWKGAARELRASTWFRNVETGKKRAQRIVNDIEEGHRECLSNGTK